MQDWIRTASLASVLVLTSVPASAFDIHLWCTQALIAPEAAAKKDYSEHRIAFIGIRLGGETEVPGLDYEPAAPVRVINHDWYMFVSIQDYPEILERTRNYAEHYNRTMISEMNRESDQATMSAH